tara:strand:- start:11719 stop:12804 length:1086 start_codon:yes stop_codon:yes gene_type:complete
MKYKKRIQKFNETNVYEESLKRIEHIYNAFDTVVVMFSGGKDSLATLHLCKEVQEKLGIKEKINVVFRDEELIPQSVIEFVKDYKDKDWIDMKYFAVPMYSQKFILGKTSTYVQWDKKRKHVRPIPEFAIQTQATDNRVFNQHNMDSYTASFYRGKIAFVNGIRASESLTRYASCMVKLNENYINTPRKSDAKNIKLCKPIFDWQENDVFRYFYEKKIKYCHIYNEQLWNADSLRVATPVHTENAKKFHKLKTYDPWFYSQIIEIFPEMILQDKYYKEFNRKSILNKYGKNLDTVFEYIKENITDAKQKHEAYEQFIETVVAHRGDPIAYPVDYILNYFLAGQYKRPIQPLPKEKQIERPS